MLRITFTYRDIVTYIKKTPNGEFSKLAKVGPVRGLAADAQGNVYAADHDKNRIMKVNDAGQVSVFAGGMQGDRDGPSQMASFNRPEAVATDKQGNVYVSDSNYIKMITPSGMVCTLAGNGECGSADGEAHKAQFCVPAGLVVDKEGNIFVVDRHIRLIRKITIKGNF